MQLLGFDFAISSQSYFGLCLLPSLVRTCLRTRGMGGAFKGRTYLAGAHRLLTDDAASPFNNTIVDAWRLVVVSGAEGLGGSVAQHTRFLRSLGSCFTSVKAVVLLVTA